MASPVEILLRRLGEVLPRESVSVDPKALENNSRDYAWFSNVLEEELDQYRAEVVAWPRDERQLADVLAAGYACHVPITVRGGGTGNYGQCVPIAGGLVLNTGRMNRVLELGDGWARVQPGVRFVELDEAAWATGQEIRIFPSTYLTATLAGFVAGGSGGVGSVTYGMLGDGNVLGATILPVRDSPAPEEITGDALGSFIHAYGTTGVLQEVRVPLAPRRRWEQAVVSFADILACHEFCLELLTAPGIDKRLITSVEASIVRYFTRARLPFDPQRAAAILIFGEGQAPQVLAIADRFGGRLDVTVAPESKTRLTDFTWNHTTLWAKKADPSLTYLQCGWDVERFPEQLRAIRAEYGDEFAVHGEYALAGGEQFLASLPIVAYKGREHLDRMVDFVESAGVGVANPHRYILEEGSRVRNVDEVLAAKRRNDPAGLLNPGKLGAWGGSLAPAGASREATMTLGPGRRGQAS